MELNCDILPRFRGLVCPTKVMFRSVLVSVVSALPGVVESRWPLYANNMTKQKIDT